MADDERDRMALPADLPRPVDDGAAAHLAGTPLPHVELASTSGGTVDIARLDRTVLYAYPRTGVPGEDPLVPDWDAIPGARGCTPEACAFRDERAALAAYGVAVVGLSTQSPQFQLEMAERLHLGFPVLSDEHLELTRALRLPTMEAAGEVLLKRLTLYVEQGRVEHVWYPVFPPDTHAHEVHEWVKERMA